MCFVFSRWWKSNYYDYYLRIRTITIWSEISSSDVRTLFTVDLCCTFPAELKKQKDRIIIISSYWKSVVSLMFAMSYDNFFFSKRLLQHNNSRSELNDRASKLNILYQARILIYLFIIYILWSTAGRVFVTKSRLK